MRHLLRCNTWYHFALLCLLTAPLTAAPLRASGAPPASSLESAYADFAVGVYLFETGAVLQAADKLEAAWRSSGGEPVVGRRLADAYFRLKNFSRSELVLDRIVREIPDDYEALLLKAKIRYLRRDKSTAIELLEHLRLTHGASFEVERMLGNMYYETGDSEKALDAFSRCIEIDPSFPTIHYRYGALLADLHRFDEAEVAFKNAYQLDPEFSEAAIRLAQIYIDTNRTAQAIPLLELVLENDISNNEALVTLGEIYLTSGMLDEGIQLLERRRRHSPMTRDAEILRGRLYYEAKDYDEALDVFGGLFEPEENSPELARILGEVSLKSGDTEKSRRYFDKAIQIDPSDYRSYLGKFFAASPNFSDGDTPKLPLSGDERAGLLQRASELIKAWDYDGNYLLGVSFLSVDSLDAAERHLLRAREQREDDQATLLNLASVYEKLGRLEDARKQLDHLHKLVPDDPTVCNFYGYLLAEMREDLQMAKTLVETALRTDPENGYYLDSLGWVYYQMGDYQQAVVELEKASRRVKDDPIILEHLGDAYRALSRFPEAKTAYERSNRLQNGSAELIEKIQSTKDRLE